MRRSHTRVKHILVVETLQKNVHGQWGLINDHGISKQLVAGYFSLAQQRRLHQNPRSPDHSASMFWFHMTCFLLLVLQAHGFSVADDIRRHSHTDARGVACCLRTRLIGRVDWEQDSAKKDAPKIVVMVVKTVKKTRKIAFWFMSFWSFRTVRPSHGQLQNCGTQR